jgi:hypothetical protein
MKAIIKQFFLHGVGKRFFYSAKILYSNLKYLSKNKIQNLEIKNQKIPISFENRKLVGVLRRESSDNS